MYRSIRGEQCGRPLVAAHDELEQVLGGGVGQLAHAEVVDDEQGHAGQLGQIVLAGVGERGLGELFEEGVGFAVDDAVALLARHQACIPSRLRENIAFFIRHPSQEDSFHLVIPPHRLSPAHMHPLEHRDTREYCTS